MSTCARCGSENCMDIQGERTAATHLSAVLHCRDRELSNLRALLRSVTGKLESAREYLDGAVDRYAAEAAAAEIDSVLEVLS